MGNIGTSWWLKKKEYDNVFKYNIINQERDYNSVCFDSAGIITNFEEANGIEKINYIDDNLHVLLIGSSGSRKKQIYFNSKYYNVRFSR